MALIEKSHSGKGTRILAGAIAAVLALWLVAFVCQRETSMRPTWWLEPPLAMLFTFLGWRRWRVVVDIAVVALPLFILLPKGLGVPNFSVVELTLLAGGLGGALRVARTGQFRWLATPLTPYLALMGLIAVLSSALFFLRWFGVLNSVFPRVLLGQWVGVFQMDKFSDFHALRAALTLIEGFVFFHVVVARVRDFRDSRHLVQLSLLSAVIVAVFGIGQYFTSWNRVEFEPWRWRINSTFPDVNSLASFLVASLFMLLPLLTVSRGWRPRGMAWWVLPVLLISLLMARSRIALAAVVLTLPLYAVLAGERFRLEKPVVWLFRKRQFLAIVYVLVLIVLGFLFLRLDWLAHTDLEWTRSSGAVAQALKGRLNIWRSAFYTLAEAPGFGCGIGTFFKFLVLHREFYGAPGEWNWNPTFENAHNYFLQLLAETGIVGGGLFLLIVGLLLYQGMRAVVMHRGEERVIFAGVLSGIVVFLLTCLTGHPLLIVDVNLWFWFLAALLFLPHAAESVEFAADQARRRGFRWFLLAVILLVAAGRWADAIKPRPTVFYGYGIHELEFDRSGQDPYAFQWLEKRAVGRLYQGTPDLEFSLRNVWGEQRPLTVTIRLNGRDLDRVYLADRRWRLCSYRLPEAIRQTSELEILSDYSWTSPTDRRQLAVQIQLLLENAWE